MNLVSQLTALVTGLRRTAAPTRAGAARPVSTSAADEAAALHDLAEAVDRPPDLLVGVLDELGDQLAGLAPGGLYPSDISMLGRSPRISATTPS